MCVVGVIFVLGFIGVCRALSLSSVVGILGAVVGVGVIGLGFFGVVIVVVRCGLWCGRCGWCWRLMCPCVDCLYCNCWFVFSRVGVGVVQ